MVIHNSTVRTQLKAQNTRSCYISAYRWHLVSDILEAFVFSNINFNKIFACYWQFDKIKLLIKIKTKAVAYHNENLALK